MLAEGVNADVVNRHGNAIARAPPLVHRQPLPWCVPWQIWRLPLRAAWAWRLWPGLGGAGLVQRAS